nr:reverse transcriptase domain-containing protein [Tanacetum cinerariifolium]
MATDGNDDPPILDLLTMEELCQPTLNGRGDDANKHLDKFLHVTQSIRVNEVTDDAVHLYLFPHSLTHHATAWFDRLPRNFINTFKKMAKMFIGKDFPSSIVTKLKNEITNFRQRPDESLFKAWERYKLSIDRFPNHNMLPVTQIDTFYNGLTLRHRDTINVAAGGTFMKRPLKAERAEINKNLMKVLQINHQVKAVTPSYETCGGPHSYNDCPATVGQTQNVYAAGAYQGGNSYQPQGNAYQGPTVPTTSSSLPQVVERKAEVTKDTVPPTNNGSTKDVQPLVVQVKTLIPNSEPVVTPVIEPVAALLELQSLTRNRMFHFPDDFVVINFDADPRVLLILRRSFLKTRKALLDVYEGELTLRVGKEAITFNLDQTSRYSANYNDMMANRIDVIDMACEEYSKEVLSFFDVIVSGNPTPYYDPIISTSSPTLTPFGDSDFLLEEVDAFVALEDDPTLPKVDHSYYDTEGDILLLEAFVNDDPSLPPPTQGILIYLIPDSPWVSLVHYVPKKGSFTVVENEENDLIPSRLVTEWRICIDYHFSKIALPMTRLLKKDTPFFFSKECVEAFQTLKRKLTEAPILVAPDWDLPFELMCDASDFAIGAVLRQRKTKHFQPIHYESKTMIDDQAHYTTREKELLAVVYAFKKFWPYLVLSKIIVYTDHSALKYLFNKQDAKPRLFR